MCWSLILSQLDTSLFLKTFCFKATFHDLSFITMESSHLRKEHRSNHFAAAMDEEAFFPSDADIDFSFTSTTSSATTATTTTTTTTDRTFACSSARTSLARSSLTLSFNESRLSTSTLAATASANHHRRPHRKSDPHWSAINAATTLSSDGALHLRHLKLLRHLGTGNLGRVFLCRLRDCDSANFALKVVDRDALTNKKLSHVQMEAEILSALDHPFLPTLYAHLEVSHYTCLLIDYCSGGDLHSLVRKQPGNRLPVDAVRFYASEVLVALEYLHATGVVYRDLKPENVLLREDGHIMLSDFDLCFKADVVPILETRARTRPVHGCFGSRKSAEEVVAEFVAEPTEAFSRSCVGTHEYLAPELVAGTGHGNGVDWWAFGVFLYEMLYGTTPFKGGTKEATLRNIASTRQVRLLARDDEEKGVGIAEARDLIERLLVKDPKKRLGCSRGATDIKRHPFFNGIKWPLIRSYTPPEARGGVARKAKAHVSHVTGVTQERRHWWWNFKKNKGSKCNFNINNNYYSHINNRKFNKCA